MCDIIERIESQGVTLEALQQVMKKRGGPLQGKWSAFSITMMVLGAVEEEWVRRAEEPKG